MYLIVGLGNPGREYENSRHNIGFKVIEEIAGRLGLKALKDKHKAFIGEGEVGGQKVLIAQPQTFMNLSGESVKALLSWYKINSGHLIVAYDDVDLEPGELRLREEGSSGGHKGVDSIINNIGDPKFVRVRIGIGRPEENIETSEYVLKMIPFSQRPILDQAVLNAADAISCIISEGVEAAMNKFNGLKEE